MTDEYAFHSPPPGYDPKKARAEREAPRSTRGFTDAKGFFIEPGAVRLDKPRTRGKSWDVHDTAERMYWNPFHIHRF